MVASYRPPTALAIAALTSFATAAPQWATVETAQLVSDAPIDGATLGASAAIAGDTSVVGATRDEVGGISFVGAAYVFERNLGGAGQWGLVKRLIGTGVPTFGAFGDSVAVDGDTIAVGALGVSVGGAVFVFARDEGGAGNWGEVAQLVPGVPVNGNAYGDSVAVSGDTIAVGSSYDDYSGVARAGAVYVYERNAGGANAWGPVAVLVASDPWVNGHFGVSVSLSGDTLAVGANLNDAGGLNAGVAYVFERDLGGPGAWGQAARLVPADLAQQDNFGRALSLSGDFVVVGSHLDDDDGNASGSAYVFARARGWGEVAKLTASDAGPQDAFGHSIGVDGGVAVIGAINENQNGFESGAAYVFDGGAGWDEVTKLTASNGTLQDRFGWSASLAGGTAVLGALNRDFGASNVEGLAFDPAAGVLYGSDTLANRLVRIDPVTGAVTSFGIQGVPDVTGLAFDPATNTLFGADNSSDRLMIFDTQTGAASIVGVLGMGNVQGLAFDSVAGTLFASNVGPNQLFSIDTTTGAATSVGPTGEGLRALGFDASSGTLYGSNKSQLLTVDPATGTTATVGSFGFGNVRSLAPGGPFSALFGADEATVQFITVDATTGAGSPLEYYGLVSNAGMAYVFELSPGTAAYCTAGVSASGCQASLTATGAASATAATGFVLTATDVEGAKDGLIFFGTGGRQANPWGNGTSYQCVVPPVKRAGLLGGSGAAGACNGLFAQSLNALWCAMCPKPGHNPGAGSYVQAQLWYRDPLNTSNRTTSLSNAVEALVSP